MAPWVSPIFSSSTACAHQLFSFRMLCHSRISCSDPKTCFSANNEPARCTTSCDYYSCRQISLSIWTGKATILELKRMEEEQKQNANLKPFHTNLTIGDLHKCKYFVFCFFSFCSALSLYEAPLSPPEPPPPTTIHHHQNHNYWHHHGTLS